MDYKRIEIGILGITDQGFAKIGTVTQGTDGSFYVSFKRNGTPMHHSWHASGLHKITEGTQEVYRFKGKPVAEIENSQHLFSGTDVERINDLMEMTQEIKQRDHIVMVDLRGSGDFGMAISYSKPEFLGYVKEHIEFQKATDVFILTKTKPYVVLIFTKDTIISR